MLIMLKTNKQFKRYFLYKPKNLAVQKIRYYFSALLFFVAHIVNAQRQEPGKPNIIFILTDDYASNLVDFMPNLKAMQQEGVTFSHYYVSNSLCCPSRSSIFTGMLPHNSGVQTNTKPIGGYDAYVEHDDAMKSFCVALQDAGY